MLIDNIKIALARNKQIPVIIAFIIAAGIIGFMYFGKIGLIVGFVAGVILPGIMAKMAIENRRKKFNSQLVDAIMLLTSCLKAGLSFNQAIEVLCQEMAPPIADEFKIVLKSLKIGVSLEDAFLELAKRMPLEELNFVMSAILVARETGGDLPLTLSKLVDTLRDRIRLKENIMTYTIQGRVQGFVMSFIPIGFIYMVLQQDKHHFDIMFQSDIGKLMVLAAVVLQILATFMIFKISKIKI